MSNTNVVISFDNVSFEYDNKKVILDEASFTVRRNSIITIVGQNGAGKSTIFKLLLRKLQPQGGQINIENALKVGIAEQVVPKDKLDLTISDYFQSSFSDIDHSMVGEIGKILNTVNLDVPLDRKVSDLSGGQKSRLLLAQALIMEPDVLLLDEPTNNLDQAGINFLTNFLINYEKTCIVISHDSDFLNCFTEGVLNLDVHTHKVEQFVGNYFDVTEQISAKLERDRRQNARLQKSIKDRYERVNKLGGKSVAMSQLARRTRKDIDEDREDIIEMRQEDKTIPYFTISNQEYVGHIIRIQKPKPTQLVKGDRLLVKGPNGIGKSTLLRSYLSCEKADINKDVRVGYYSQDFSELDLEQTAFDSLLEVSKTKVTQDIYETGAKFLLTGDMLHAQIKSLSEGQKGLLCYGRFVLLCPGLLILDEPTNHINFRHIPVIAKAINNYEGPIILVSHDNSFVEKLGKYRELDLSKYLHE